MALKKVEGELKIDEDTQRFYLNGKEIVTRTEFVLGNYNMGRIVVTAAGVSAAVALMRFLVVDLKWFQGLVSS